MTRRREVLKSLGLFGSGAVVGAGGLAAGLSIRDRERRQADDAVRELVLVTGKEEGDDRVRQQLIDKWNSLPGRPKARMQEISDGADAERQAMIKRARGEEGPVDVYNLDVTLVEEFRSAGYLHPLEDEEAILDIDDFLPVPMATCRDSGNRLWCLPFNTDAGLLYHHESVPLPSDPHKQLPALFDDLTRAMAAAGQSAKAAYIGQMADYEGLTVNAMEIIWAFGGEVIRDGEALVDSPAARQAMVWWAGQLEAGTPQGFAMESLTSNEKASSDLFKTGKVLAMRNWPFWYNKMAQEKLAAGEQVDFLVNRLPGPSVLGGQNLAVASRTSSRLWAQRLIEFLTSHLSQQLLFERGGYAATRRVVYRDAEVGARYPYAQTLLSAVEQARPRPSTAHYALFSKVFRDGVLHALRSNGQWPSGFARRLEEAMRGRVV